MYASLIGAGISQLYDLYQSATGGSSGGSSGVRGASFPPPSADDAASSSGTAPGSGLSDSVHKLMVDLQANSTTPATNTDATATVANDLHSVFKQAGVGGHHGGHHGHPAAASAGSAPTTEAGAAGSSDPFGTVASSLLAYARNQGLGASSASSTSLTA